MGLYGKVLPDPGSFVPRKRGLTLRMGWRQGILSKTFPSRGHARWACPVKMNGSVLLGKEIHGVVYTRARTVRTEQFENLEQAGTDRTPGHRHPRRVNQRSRFDPVGFREGAHGGFERRGGERIERGQRGRQGSKRIPNLGRREVFRDGGLVVVDGLLQEWASFFHELRELPDARPDQFEEAEQPCPPGP